MKTTDRNKTAVQGEGDYKSAAKYAKSVRSFVQSGKVDEAASKAKPATPQEQEELLNAERAGLAHSKGEDVGPAGPTGAPGATGSTGATGSAGGTTAIAVMPPTSAPAN